MNKTLLSIMLCSFATSAQAGDRENDLRVNSFKSGDFSATWSASTTLTGESYSGFEVDADANDFENSGLLLPRLRLGADATYAPSKLRFGLHAEHDVVTGFVGGADEPEGTLMPGSGGLDSQLRKLYVDGSYGRDLFFGAGFMTSHWGLGILANDGSKVWTPGSARFVDPRGGDRVVRAYLGAGISDDWGAGISLAADRVWDDDILRNDDEANQLIAAISLGQGKSQGGGAYIVRRSQESGDGKDLDVWAFDVTAFVILSLGDETSVKLEGEGAYIYGTTNLAPNTNFQEYDIRQALGALRATFATHRWGAVLDGVFATGDANFDDDLQVGAKVDPRYEMGLLTFRQVLAAQSGRGVATASDPNLVGVPAEDIDRIATQGSVTNTLTIFPRLWVRPWTQLEIYGGPMFSFVAEEYADPFNSRLGGGTPRNPRDGEPGNYFGTEFDLGMRYSGDVRDVNFQLGVEAGILKPGSALQDRASENMDVMYGGRIILDVRI